QRTAFCYNIPISKFTTNKKESLIAEKEEKNSIKKYIIFFILAFIYYSLINTFIWEKYFYTPTAFDAFEIENGVPGHSHEIDDKNEIAILTTEDAFHVYTHTKKLMGW